MHIIYCLLAMRSDPPSAIPGRAAAAAASSTTAAPRRLGQGDPSAAKHAPRPQEKRRDTPREPTVPKRRRLRRRALLCTGRKNPTKNPAGAGDGGHRKFALPAGSVHARSPLPQPMNSIISTPSRPDTLPRRCFEGLRDLGAGGSAPKPLDRGDHAVIVMRSRSATQYCNWRPPATTGGRGASSNQQRFLTQTLGCVLRSKPG